MSKHLAIFLSAFLVAACSEESRELSAYQAEMRIRLFRECMAVLPSIHRQADDDVADAINACDSSAAWQSLAIKRVMK